MYKTIFQKFLFSTGLQRVDFVRNGAHDATCSGLGQHNGVPVQQFLGVLTSGKASINVFHQDVQLVCIKIVNGVLDVRIALELRKG
jgi:hypothetical protein